MAEYFIGIDIGGTNIKIGCFDSELEIVSKTSITTGAEMDPDIVMDNIAETVKTLVTEAVFSMEDVCAVGLGVPGPAKYSQGLPICRNSRMFLLSGCWKQGLVNRL